MKHKLLIPSVVIVLATSFAAPATSVLAQDDPPPTSTPVPRSKWVTQPVKFGTLKTYSHDPAWFEIDVPTNWTVDDTSKDDEAIVTFTDPTKNGAVYADVFADTDELSKADMAERLDTFIKSYFGKLTKFTATDANEMDNLNGASQFFRYTTKLSNGKTVTMYGDAFYEQYDTTLVSILVLLLPEEQYVTVKKQAYAIVNSFKALPENYEASTTPTEDPTAEPTGEFELGDLTEYQHKSGVYSLSVPGNWDEKDNSSGDFIQTIWQDSTGQGLVIASAAAADKTYKTSELQNEAVSYIKSFTKNTQRFKSVKVGTKSVKAGVAYVNYSYTYVLNGEDVPVVGIIAAKQEENTIGFLQVAVPADNADAVSDAVDEILSSFTIDGSVSF